VTGPWFDIGLRLVLWLAIASIGMIPFWWALRRYRASTQGTSLLRSASTRQLLDTRQSDPDLEQERRAVVRRGVIGLIWIWLSIPIFVAFLRT
jgi:hypothetical protein